MNSEAPKLTEPVGKEKSKKKKRIDRILTCVEIFLVIVIVVAGYPLTLMLVRNMAYGEVFFVNGASMYPTLNKDAVRPSENRLLTWKDSRAKEGDLLDYGWGKKAESSPTFYQDLKRFDVVDCFYPTDYTSDGAIRATSSVKIKRLIAFPGETVTITYDPARDPNEVFGYSVWGETSIKDVNGNVFTLPNLYSEKDYPDILNSNGTVEKYLSLGNPVDGMGEVYKQTTWVLGEDEYFVCGDNRRGGKSGDSRTFAAKDKLKKHMIIGKSCLITGRREFHDETVSFRLDQVRAPWDYINLENHP